MTLNELYNKIIDLDLSEYTHQKLYDLCFKLDDEIEELRALYESEREVKEEYKSKVNKAIEYIENYLCSDEYIQSDINSIANAFVKLLNILKGADKK